MTEKAYPLGIDRLMEFVFDRMPKDEPEMALDKRRERGLDDLAAVIEGHYGPRCTRNQGGCVCCSAWAIYDCLERLLDNVKT